MTYPSRARTLITEDTFRTFTEDYRARISLIRVLMVVEMRISNNIFHGSLGSSAIACEEHPQEVEVRIFESSASG